MGKVKFVSSEWGMSMKLGNKTFKIVGTEDTELNSNDLIFAANNDAMSFITLYHLGIYYTSTFVWLPTHAIEKYLKACLLQNSKYNEAELRKIGHNVKKLWNIFNTEFKFGEYINIEEYIEEISEISPPVRYGGQCVAINDNFLSGFIFFIVYFNKVKMGNENYMNSYYGFLEHELSQFNMISKKYLINTFKKYLHLIIEHQVTISPTGITHPHKYCEVKYLKQNRVDENCPFCNNKASLNISQISLTNTNACREIEEYLNKQ